MKPVLSKVNVVPNGATEVVLSVPGDEENGVVVTYVPLRFHVVPKSARPDPTIDAPAFATSVAVVSLRLTVTGTQPNRPHRSWKSSTPPPKRSVEPAFISAKVNGSPLGESPKLPMPPKGTTMESSLNCSPELLVVMMRTVTVTT